MDAACTKQNTNGIYINIYTKWTPQQWNMFSLDLIAVINITYLDIVTACVRFSCIL